MLIAYLSLDEVNQDLAVRLAGEQGMLVYLPGPHEVVSDELVDVVLYDWDYLTVPQRQLLAALLAGPGPRRAAVHGFTLAEAQVEALRRRGVAVFRRLEPRLFQNLARASSPRPSASSHEADRSSPSHFLDGPTLR